MLKNVKTVKKKAKDLTEFIRLFKCKKASLLKKADKDFTTEDLYSLLCEISCFIDLVIKSYDELYELYEENE